MDDILVFKLRTDIDSCKKYKYSSNCINTNIYNDIQHRFLDRLYNLDLNTIKIMYPFFEITEYSSYDKIPENLYYDLSIIIIDYSPMNDIDSINNFLYNMCPVV